MQEDNAKTKFLLQGERDEANSRTKKLVKQVDRLQLQLSEAKDQVRDLNTQLAEATDYKVTMQKSHKTKYLNKYRYNLVTHYELRRT